MSDLYSYSLDKEDDIFNRILILLYASIMFQFILVSFINCQFVQIKAVIVPKRNSHLDKIDLTNTRH